MSALNLKNNVQQGHMTRGGTVSENHRWQVVESSMRLNKSAEKSQRGNVSTLSSTAVCLV